MVNTDDFIKRLELILDYYAISASVFADKVGVQRSSVSHLLSGRNKPSLEFILKIIESFPEVNLYWLLKGEGTFPQSEVPKQKTSPILSQNSTKEELKPVSDPSIDLFTNVNNMNLSIESAMVKKETVENSSASTEKSNSEIQSIVILYKNGLFKNYSPE